MQTIVTGLLELNIIKYIRNIYVFALDILLRI